MQPSARRAALRAAWLIVGIAGVWAAAESTDPGIARAGDAQPPGVVTQLVSAADSTVSGVLPDPPASPTDDGAGTPRPTEQASVTKPGPKAATKSPLKRRPVTPGRTATARQESHRAGNEAPARATVDAVKDLVPGVVPPPPQPAPALPTTDVVDDILHTLAGPLPLPDVELHLPVPPTSPPGDLLRSVDAQAAAPPGPTDRALPLQPDLRAPAPAVAPAPARSVHMVAATPPGVTTGSAASQAATQELTQPQPPPAPAPSEDTDECGAASSPTVAGCAVARPMAWADLRATGPVGNAVLDGCTKWRGRPGCRPA